MTIIAYKDGVLASDTAEFMGNIITSTSRVKLFRHPNMIIGISGFNVDTQRLIHAIFSRPDLTGASLFNEIQNPDTRSSYFPIRSEKEDDYKGASALILATRFENDGHDGFKPKHSKTFDLLEISFGAISYSSPDECSAVGAGEAMALAAMRCGKSAKDAVAFCIQHHAFCAGRVDSQKFDLSS